MKNTSGFVEFMYGTCIGRCVLKVIMKLRLDKIAVSFLRSPLSKCMIGWYAKRNNIPLSDEEKDSFATYRDFFVRTRISDPVDSESTHLISPCDGYLSAYKIDDNSCFHIKSSHYMIKDFLNDEELAKNYRNGACLIFRLCPSDYHHYCFIDNGYQGKNDLIPGVLHSVQPIACERFPVYVLNKRSWCLLSTENFGPVVQCEIGALVVGGIFNEKENAPFEKGQEKGHFELAGSTIVLLFEADKIELKEEFSKAFSGEEVRVLHGEWIGNKV